MANKKYTILLVMLFAMQIASFAQTSGWDWKDSSVVPEKSVSQYHEFLQNTNPYPAKPRNAWEYSLGLGEANIQGDVLGKAGLGFSTSLRKSLSNILSYRLSYDLSLNHGNGATYANYNSNINISPASGFLPYVTHDYKNTSHNLNIDLIVSLNTFSNYRGNPTGNLYLFGGVGIGASTVKIKDGSSWVTVSGSGIPSKNFIAINGKVLYYTTFDFGGGYSYKINNKFNLGIEEHIVSPVKRVGYLDGYNSQTGVKDIFWATYLKLNFNL